MSFFDSMIESSFAEKKDGTILFFPWGRMGRAWRITPECKKKVVEFLRQFYMGSFAALGLGVLLGGIWGAGVLPLVAGWYATVIPGLLDGMQKLDNAVSMDEEREHQAQRMGISGTAVLLGLNVFLVLISIMVSVFSEDNEGRIVGWAGLFFFGIGVYYFTRQLFDLLRRK